MQTNTSNSQQHTPGDSQQQQQPLMKMWKGKLQGPVGRTYRVVVDNVAYVGVVVRAVESAGGEYYRLRFLDNGMRDIARERCVLTQEAITQSPPPTSPIGNALLETEREPPAYPGQGRRTRARPYLNQ